MGLLTSVPAVRQVETERPDLYAFDLVGHVSAADVENFYGLLEAAYALQSDDRRCSSASSTRKASISADASRRTLDEGKAHAGEHVRRCALVGNTRAMPEIERFFASSVEIRRFADKDEQAGMGMDRRRPLEGK